MVHVSYQMPKNNRVKTEGANFTCKLTKADIEKIRTLKDIKGFPTTIDLFRYLLTMEYDKAKEVERRNAEAVLESMVTKPGFIVQEKVPILK